MSTRQRELRSRLLSMQVEKTPDTEGHKGVRYAPETKDDGNSKEFDAIKDSITKKKESPNSENFIHPDKNLYSAFQLNMDVSTYLDRLQARLEEKVVSLILEVTRVWVAADFEKSVVIGTKERYFQLQKEIHSLYCEFGKIRAASDVSDEYVSVIAILTTWHLPKYRVISTEKVLHEESRLLKQIHMLVPGILENLIKAAESFQEEWKTPEGIDFNEEQLDAIANRKILSGKKGVYIGFVLINGKYHLMYVGSGKLSRIQAHKSALDSFRKGTVEKKTQACDTWPEGIDVLWIWVDDVTGLDEILLSSMEFVLVNIFGTYRFRSSKIADSTEHYTLQRNKMCGGRGGFAFKRTREDFLMELKERLPLLPIEITKLKLHVSTHWKK